MSFQSSLNNLTSIAAQLSPERILLLTEMANALTRNVVSKVSPTSNIVSRSFNDDFAGRLVLFHAMHDAALTKKTFEYFFCGSSRAAGRSAFQTSNSVHPGEDVNVNGQKFSLKTESGKKINPSYIHISKLMEARWIRDCVSKTDCCFNAITKVGNHLSHYERILTLRSFVSDTKITYQLVEIPMEVLKSIARLIDLDFSERTGNGSSSATVRGDDGSPMFTLSLDGSVEKITVRTLSIRLCTIHAVWDINLT
ncbi:MAG: hypothetical protein O9274_11050 [Limnobacter sp.]|uniref:hypothetical protein n=1 Tax=Limnobacter sp. TaxID=2003368 RepID=UPI0022BB6957|nr:hypothetical protein [Limnobacter sp.]MCZ8016226.1 hypothetical protein [Limnobacter sp.]